MKYSREDQEDSRSQEEEYPTSNQEDQKITNTIQLKKDWEDKHEENPEDRNHGRAESSSRRQDPIWNTEEDVHQHRR